MELRKSSYSIHKRPAAKRWAERRLAQQQDRRENLTLAEYATGFWKPEESFAADQAAHGRPVPQTYLWISPTATPGTTCCRFGAGIGCAI